jgi:ribosomal protein L37AE/L43A
MDMNDRMNHECVRCRKVITPIGRFTAGYNTCITCGDAISSQTVRTIVPMHKSNYTLVTRKSDLIGINTKGGK